MKVTLSVQLGYYSSLDSCKDAGVSFYQDKWKNIIYVLLNIYIVVFRK